MLQTKDRAALSRETNLIEAVNGVAESFKNAQVEHFLDELKIALQTNDPSDKEALLQRASQGEKVRKLIQDFQALSEQDREKLTGAGSSILQKIPAPQKAALVQQVSHELDGAVGRKTTSVDDGAGGKTTITATPNGRGGTYTSHTRDRNGNVVTDTATRDKNGNLVHRHNHAHANGATATNTQSAQDGVATHGHTHMDDGRGNHATVTTENGIPVHAEGRR